MADPGEEPSPPPPLFLDQTETRRAPKKFLKPAPPPLPPALSQGLDGRAPLSEGLDPPLVSAKRELIVFLVCSSFS